jgi:UDP-N-acetylglucosamine--dolichyl-phosphate N-acetylglucosaminephosphotransferase
LFPKVPDQHKPNKPLVPNGLGVFYILVSVTSLFVVYYLAEYHYFAGYLGMFEAQNGVSKPLTLAVCILFGGFMGMLDDWIDVRWRYKAFLPLIAAIPLVSLAYKLSLRPMITIPFIGVISFGDSYYFLVIPILVTIITNTVNQLGGLNGLETVPPAIVMIGLTIISGPDAILLYIPLIVWLLLAVQNFRGKIFVGNTGSFAIGMTLAAFAIISDVKFDLAVSILPYILNSSLILLTFFLFRRKASVSFDGEKLHSDHRRSLVTLVTYNRRLSERQVVIVISALVTLSTFVALLIQWLSL